MARYPALDLRFAPGPGAGALQDLLYAELDAFEPAAIEDLDAGDGWRVFFRTASQRDAASHAVGTALGGHVLDLTSLEIDDEDWASRSQADLRAIRIGRIVVAPPWDVPKSGESSDIVIVIEPSMGFGTGHHATTRLCLELLQETDLRGKRVIDVGTGSGVLAIATARLGAAGVTAIDNDPDAVDSARANLHANGVERQIELRLTDLGEVNGAADVLVANLTGAVLTARAERLGMLVKAGAVAILSGFAPDEVDAIVAAWPAWTRRVEKREGEWAAITLGRTCAPV